MKACSTGTIIDSTDASAEVLNRAARNPYELTRAARSTRKASVRKTNFAKRRDTGMVDIPVDWTEVEVEEGHPNASK